MLNKRSGRRPPFESGGAMRTALILILSCGVLTADVVVLKDETDGLVGFKDSIR